MAQPKVVLALDSGALIQAEKDVRIEATIEEWFRNGAVLLIPAPVIAECIRNGPRDAAANRLIRKIDNVADVTENVARRAGAMLGRVKGSSTVDSLIAASAEMAGATDILTSDPKDLTKLVGSTINIIAL